MYFAFELDSMESLLGCLRATIWILKHCQPQFGEALGQGWKSNAVSRIQERAKANSLVY